MKTIHFFSIVSLFGFLPVYGTGAETLSEESVNNSRTLRENVVSKARELFERIDRNSEDYQSAAVFYGGQNILNICDANYEEGFSTGQYSLEHLLGVYENMQSFLDPDGRFRPKELNEGFAHSNYQLLRTIFEGNN
ncbi:MAG: hypothetical protein H6492_00825 [Candidatus Paracaedibacteraceae bacterium]|nr:hypothetical protein [Candidatus Paracaedibacteraceae bacterium]